MKKVIYENFGNPVEVLKVIEEDPKPLAEGDLRVEVLRSPINPSDLIQIAGNYGVRPQLPAVAGNEGLGRVVEGEGLPIGQLVLLPVGQGTWVSEVVAPAAHFTPLPEGDLDQLSMLLVNPATAWLMLTEFMDLKEGDWMIQSAANSGVGGYLVQLCKARGINLINVVRRESAIPGLEELGAAHVLVDGPDLPKRVKQAAGAPMKLALDAVAGETFGRLGETLERGGTLVNYGAMSLEPAAMQAGTLIFRDIRVRGFWLVNWFERASKEERMATYAKLTEMVLKGELYAPIDRHFGLDEIQEAAGYTWQGARTGKVLVAPNGI